MDGRTQAERIEVAETSKKSNYRQKDVRQSQGVKKVNEPEGEDREKKETIENRRGKRCKGKIADS